MQTASLNDKQSQLPPFSSLSKRATKKCKSSQKGLCWNLFSSTMQTLTNQLDNEIQTPCTKCSGDNVCHALRGPYSHSTLTRNNLRTNSPRQRFSEVFLQSLVHRCVFVVFEGVTMARHQMSEQQEHVAHLVAVDRRAVPAGKKVSRTILICAQINL